MQLGAPQPFGSVPVVHTFDLGDQLVADMSDRRQLVFHASLGVEQRAVTDKVIRIDGIAFDAHGTTHPVRGGDHADADISFVVFGFAGISHFGSQVSGI